MDSLLNLRLMSRTQIQDALARCRPPVNRLIERCDRSESGTETMVRLRLKRRQVKVRPQVIIAGIGRVDLLVGDRLVIEVDSRAHHCLEDTYQRDRQRDRTLMTMGYLVIRLTYGDVVHRWPEVEPDILALIRGGAHRWPIRRLKPVP